MKKSKLLLLALATSLLTVGCQQNDSGKVGELEKKLTESQKKVEELTMKLKEAGVEEENKAEAPGESGFQEFDIDELKKVGPFEVAAVYFQGVDMIPEGKQPSAAESDMHLEADIHLIPEFAKQYGFGGGKGIWPAYLTVNYKVMQEGKEITSGTMMPMNADDGAHYGVNVKKDLIKVGKYKLIIEIQPSSDYLLHTDEETGVPVIKESGKEGAAKYFQKQVVEFDWDYTAQQLQNR